MLAVCRCFECESEISAEILGPKNLTKYQMFSSQIERALGAVSKSKKSSATTSSSITSSTSLSSSKYDQDEGGDIPATAAGVIVKGLRNLG
jgi:hypothetical protein